MGGVDGGVFLQNPVNRREREIFVIPTCGRDDIINGETTSRSIIPDVNITKVFDM